MKKVRAGALVAALAMALVLLGFWAMAEQGSGQAQGSGEAGIVVTGLTGTASSITLPGDMDTGEITLSLDTEPPHPVGSLHQSSGTGTLFWPAVADFPLLHDLGRDPLELVLIGPFFTDAPSDFLIGYDIGFIDDPLVGAVYFSNNNKNQKEIGPILVAACTENPSVDGTFVDIGREAFDTLERDRLRGMMDQAMASLRAFDPSVPDLPAEVLDTFFDMYDSDPNTELIMYFQATDSYQTSQLTGTDQLTVVCPPTGGMAELPAPVAGSSGPNWGVWAGVIAAAAAGALALAAGGWYARRRLS
jgi:hypothetical protein